LPYEPFGYGDTERCIEIPWAMSCYRNEQKVLDVGYAHSEERYINPLLSLRISQLYGIDIACKEVKGLIPIISDIRKTSFSEGFFDLVLCISTIEHIGRDNSKYIKTPEQIDLEGDFKALAEIVRITKKGGRIVLTVPYGMHQDHGWFIHYDNMRWSELLKASKCEILREDFFIYKDGWRTSSREGLENISYQDNSAPAAAGLVCVLLSK
jgi:hypothetical protein